MLNLTYRDTFVCRMGASVLQVWFTIMSLGVAVIVLSACDTVPREAVELSNTVGRDLEEVHRAHRELALLHFGRIESDIDRFVDETYRPEYIAEFAKEFRLDHEVRTVLEEDPSSLLPMLTYFVQLATNEVERKRGELLGPIQEQKNLVLEEIDAAHRQIQQAHAVVTGHLASVRKVREVQQELLSEVGLGDLREKIAKKTAEISGSVGDLVDRAKEVEDTVDDAGKRLKEFDGMIDDFRVKIDGL